jgi:cysteinyl-tRNA synthetase
VSFSYDSLSAADQALSRLRDKWSEYETIEEEKHPYTSDMTRLINDDLDTPRLLAFVWEKIKDEGVTPGQKKSMLADLDTLLGLDLGKKEVIPADILALVHKRQQAREDKNFAESDRLRDELDNLGYTLSDNEEGSKIRKKKSLNE